MVAACLRHLRFLPALLVVLGLVSGAQARHYSHHRHHRHHWHNLYSDEREPQPLDAGQANVTSPQPQAGGIAAVVAEVIRACANQSAELQKMPLDVVLKTVQPNDDQRNALERIRSAAADAGKKMNASCPKDVPVPLTDRLDTMRASLDAIRAALLPLRPVFVSGYAALTDEQKARLIAISIPQRGQPPAGPEASNLAVGNHAQSALSCRQRLAMLKIWPLNRIEGELALSDEQHAALYALMAAVYRGATSLAASCHDEDALTPVSRLDAQLGLVNALRGWISGIAPVLARFVNALSADQNAQLNTILGVSPQQTTAR